MEYKLVECMEMDINDGFKKVVNMEVNEALVNLQDKNAKILEVSAPLVNGRKVYITVTYLKEMAKAE